MAYLGMCYFDWCLFTDDAMVEEERRLHQILFPSIEFRYQAFCTARDVDPNVEPPDGRWLNAKCDVQALWCHVREGGGVFVTSDGNFHKASKKPVLEHLGAGVISYSAGCRCASRSLGLLNSCIVSPTTCDYNVIT